MKHIWTMSNKNAHNCERIAIKLYEWENINWQDNFVYKLSSLTHRNEN